MSVFSSFLKAPFRAIEKKIANAKHDIKVEATAIIAKMVVLMIIAFFVLLAISLLSIACALLINEQLNHPFYGYLWVGGFYLLLAALFFTLHKTGAIDGSFKEVANKIVFGSKNSA